MAALTKERADKLIADVKACTEPNGWFDADLWDALHSWPEGGPYSYWKTAASAFGWKINLTGSLDAVLPLARRVAGPGLLEISGGWNPADPEEWPAWTVRWYPSGVPRDGRSWHAAIGTARTPALALLATLLEVASREVDPVLTGSVSDQSGAD